MAAKLVKPDKAVMAIVGDGGFLMNSQVTRICPPEGQLGAHLSTPKCYAGMRAALDPERSSRIDLHAWLYREFDRTVLGLLKEVSG